MFAVSRAPGPPASVGLGLAGLGAARRALGRPFGRSAPAIIPARLLLALLLPQTIEQLPLLLGRHAFEGLARTPPEIVGAAAALVGLGRLVGQLAQGLGKPLPPAVGGAVGAGLRTPGRGLLTPLLWALPGPLALAFCLTLTPALFGAGLLARLLLARLPLSWLLLAGGLALATRGLAFGLLAGPPLLRGALLAALTRAPLGWLR